MAKEKKKFDLAAALGDVSNLDTGADGREQIEYIDFNLLRSDDRNFYAVDGIEELAANIEFAGLQQPIRVRPDDKGVGYVIVSGHRRHAALRKLVDDGVERFRSVPCIVERDTATGETAALLQELRLIYANCDTRRMSSADLAKQAERVEMLLYQLKEAGVEFPGRMRDHVAEACKVSKSKLARLKVIRENLDGEMKEQWLTGKLNENEAYNLAKLPPEHRALVWARKGAHSWGYGGGTAVETYGKRLKAVDASPVPKTCLAGGVCENLAGRREKSLSDNIYNASRCEHCCHSCSNIATCDYACPRLADEIAEAKLAKRDERAAQKARTEIANRPIIELLSRLWLRFGVLLSVHGADLEELKCKCRWWRTPIDNQKFMALATGAKTPTVNDPTPLGWYVSRDGVNVLLELADALGVSLDYLLCRTDDPTPASRADAAPQWHTGTPPKAGEYLCDISYSGGDGLFEVVEWDAQRGKWRLYQNGFNEEDHATVERWFPLPAEPSRAAGNGNG